MSLTVEKSRRTDDNAYRVHHSQWGIYVTGDVPVNEAAALLSCWHAAGLEFLAVDVAMALDASVAVTNTAKHANLWLAAIAPDARESANADERPPF